MNGESNRHMSLTPTDLQQRSKQRGLAALRQSHDKMTLAAAQIASLLGKRSHSTSDDDSHDGDNNLDPDLDLNCSDKNIIVSNHASGITSTNQNDLCGIELTEVMNNDQSQQHDKSLMDMAAERNDDNVVKRSCMEHVIVFPGGGSNILSVPEPTTTLLNPITFPFLLDPFQTESCGCIDNGNSVLISAHTSAGKTAIALYAIGAALRDNKRVIYTAPVKALSNQKYREFSIFFRGNVGLLTGDVTLNPNAPCLIMTTEVLRALLLKQGGGDTLLSELSWVIFDEIHYIRDRERGFVWEQTILLLPSTVHLVFLSASAPNATEFAAWIADTQQSPCHVVTTTQRPIPLYHYILPSSDAVLHLVIGPDGEFRKGVFNTVIDAQVGNTEKIKTDGRNKEYVPSSFITVVKFIRNHGLTPALFFCFSRRECEALAIRLLRQPTFNSDDEAEAVSLVCERALLSLSEEDRSLVHVKHSLSLLQRGIGLHHSGLLPVVREVTELLFQEGFIKILIATETFAVGVNMPAHTVVFTKLRKWDGQRSRLITSGEYVQMAGRAGRRGIDTHGVVISMLDEAFIDEHSRAEDTDAALHIFVGEALRLESRFQLTYSIVLNISRLNIDPTSFLAKSFRQFQFSRNLPLVEHQIYALASERTTILAELNGDGGSDSWLEIQRLLEGEQLLASLGRSLFAKAYHPSNLSNIIYPGTIVLVSLHSASSPFRNEFVPLNDQHVDSLLYDRRDVAWAVIVHYDASITQPCVDLLLPNVQVGVSVSYDVVISPPPLLSLPFTAIHPGVVSMTIDCICAVTSLTAVLPTSYAIHDLQTYFSKLNSFLQLYEKNSTVGSSTLFIFPCADEKSEVELSQLWQRVRTLQSTTIDLQLKLSNHSLYQQQRSQILRLNKISEELNYLKEESYAARDVMLDEMRIMRRVLRRLKLMDGDSIEVKGRVACEITIGDELAITELIFSGVMTECSAEEIFAMLSCYVHEERCQNARKLSKRLQECYDAVMSTAITVGRVVEECHAQPPSNGPRTFVAEPKSRRFGHSSNVSNQSPAFSASDYALSFRSDFMPLIVAQCSGASFSTLTTLTPMFEGSIVRTMRRTLELGLQVQKAIEVIGDSVLSDKISQGIKILSNGLCFTSSLYIGE